MNIIINIIYNAPDIDSKTMRSGLFPLRGKNPVEVAYEFWKWIQSEEPLELELMKVVYDEENDITDLVKNFSLN
jgi:hypothetical protein